MSIAFWCIFAAALLPYAWVGYAKATPRYLRGTHNKDPRAYGAALDGARKRAYLAHLNAFEAFPPFAAAVIVAHLSGAPPTAVDGLAVAFIVLRLLHGLLYVTDQDKMRTVVWMGGMGCVCGLFVLAGVH